jgi:signal transduction histidine kinase
MAERAEAEDREVWRTIAQQAQRISSAIDRLMIFSSPPPAHPERVDFAESIEEIISDTFSKIPPNAKPPRCDKTIEARPVIWADASQIREAIGELLANAVAACEPDRDIRLTARPRPDKAVEITVFDGGAGMSRPRLAKAMLPFASGPQAGGYDGLGLCRAWRLIANNQGRMRITSQPGQGTTVEVILPAAD